MNSSATPDQQDSRSGYWRLFFIQMQSDLLSKLEVKAVVPEEVTVAIAAPTKKKKKQVVTKKVVAAKGSTYTKAPEFRPLPAFTPIDDLLRIEETSLRISQQVKDLVAGYEKVVIESKKALDDSDEEDVELMLLLAA